MAQGRQDFPLFTEVKHNMSEASRVKPLTYFADSIFKKLHKTLDSMDPMIREMDSMDPVFRHILERLKDLVPPSPEFQRQLAQRGHSNGTELEELDEKLKKFFKGYVMLKLDQANEVEDQANGPAERVFIYVLELSTEVGCLIKNEMPKANDFMKYVFGNLEIIRDSIDGQLLTLIHHQQPYSGPPNIFDVPQLLRLLKQIKVLLRFLHGHHGLDIQKYLADREKGLRRFVDDEVQKRLEHRDHENKELQRERDDFKPAIICFFAGVFVLYMTYPPKSLKYLIVFMVALYFTFAIFLSKITELRRKIDEHKPDIVLYFIMIVVLYMTYPPKSLISSNIFMADLIIMLILLYSQITDYGSKKGRVFLNFRGVDVRHVLAILLRDALEKEGIATYMDESGMPYGGTIPEELKMAINNSIGAVTIFSKRYAESDDCLAELLLIQERRLTYKDYVLFPVFYNVEPEKLLAERGSKYRSDLIAHTKGKHYREVKEWTRVLRSFAEIKGEPYKSDQHYMNNLINTVVADVKRQLENQRRPGWQ